MGTLSSIDVINQYYQLRLDIFDSSYATLCVEAIDRSLEPNEVSLYHYKLLEFVLNKISEGNSAQLMSIIVLLKCMNKFGFGAFSIIVQLLVILINLSLLLTVLNMMGPSQKLY